MERVTLDAQLLLCLAHDSFFLLARNAVHAPNNVLEGEERLPRQGNDRGAVQFDQTHPKVRHLSKAVFIYP